MLKRDPFGHLLILKRLLIITIGWITWFRYARYNTLKIEGVEHLAQLPKSGVLFISNHQTYFADVIAMLHIFCAAKNGYINTIQRPWYLFRPKIDTYFVAAEETMRKGWLPRVFAYAGAIPVQRTWRQDSSDVKRQVRMDDITNIGLSLKDGWVINFPQGTTKVYAQGRRGVTHLVKKFNPVVVPIVIDGFRRAFDKRGLKLKKTGITLSVRFKPPLNMNHDQDANFMLDDLMHAIEQSEQYQWPRQAKEGVETK